jgi:hypothetical protein
MDDDYGRLLGRIDRIFSQDFDAARRAVRDWEEHSKSIAEAWRSQYGNLSEAIVALQRNIDAGLALSVRRNLDVLNQSMRTEQMMNSFYRLDAVAKAFQDSARIASDYTSRDLHSSFRALTNLYRPSQIIIDRMLKGHAEKFSN